MRLAGFAFLGFLFAFGSARAPFSPALAGPISTTTDARIDAQCARYFPREECRNAIGRWLPYAFSDSWTWREKAAVLTATDHFSGIDDDRAAGILAVPRDGSPFVYGTAGPPSGRVVYDPVHHVALYEQGCCDWAEIVLASKESPPPGPVAHRDLSAVHLERGIGLGATVSEVERVYDHAFVHAVAGRPGLTVLAYRGPPIPHQPTCGNDQNFYVRHRRVVAIQLGTGC